MLQLPTISSLFVGSQFPKLSKVSAVPEVYDPWSAQKSLSDVSSLPKYLTDLQDLQTCLWQPQDLD